MIVLPGVTIGDNTIVAAGGVVTHDLPANVIAAGTPAKVLREITAEDDKSYDKGIPVSEELLEKYGLR